eukprot:8459391-Karenia_brevis.AAC.1
MGFAPAANGEHVSRSDLWSQVEVKWEHHRGQVIVAVVGVAVVGVAVAVDDGDGDDGDGGDDDDRHRACN